MTFRELRNILNELPDRTLNEQVLIDVGGIVVDISTFEIAKDDSIFNDGDPYLSAKPGCRG